MRKNIRDRLAKREGKYKERRKHVGGQKRTSRVEQFVSQFHIRDISILGPKFILPCMLVEKYAELYGFHSREVLDIRNM